MKNLEEYVQKYTFNEGLNEDHYTITEGVMDWLRDFWDWLKGDENRKDFNVWDDNYDEGEKKKYINDHDSSAIKVQPAKDLEMVVKLIEKEKPSKEQKSIFNRTSRIIEKLGDKANEVKWTLLMFTSDDLKECAGIIGFLEQTELGPNGAVECIVIDINRIYSNIVNLAVVRDTILKLAKEYKAKAIVFTDLEKSVAQKLKSEYSFDLSELSSHKGYFIHTME